VGPAVDLRPDALQIRKPAPPGFIVGMTDIVPAQGLFSANRADFCHDDPANLYCVRIGLLTIYKNE
jgi:hypothetical protein